jgi:hypothetical protein
MELKYYQIGISRSILVLQRVRLPRSRGLWADQAGVNGIKIFFFVTDVEA